MSPLFFFALFFCCVLCTETHVWLPGDSRTFTLVTLGDTQWLDGDSFEQQTDWACQCESTLRMAYVVQLGDIVDQPSGDRRMWNVASSSMQTLEDCGISWAVLPGNHDLGAVTDYDATFPASRFHATGSFPSGSGRNTYKLVTIHNADGWSVSLLFLQLGYLPAAQEGVIPWAGSVLSAYPERQAFLFTHSAGEDCSDLINNDVTALLTLHCNLLFVANGHAFECGGERVTPLARVPGCLGGGTQYVITSDYQGRADGGEGWLRYYRFTYSVLGDLVICATTYSPQLDEYEHTALGRFALSYTSSTNAGSIASLDLCPAEPPCVSTYVASGYVIASLWIASLDFLFFLHLWLVTDGANTG
jgi:hypothetical protein